MAYDYTIDAWLPPMTGLEVGSLARRSRRRWGGRGLCRDWGPGLSVWRTRRRAEWRVHAGGAGDGSAADSVTAASAPLHGRRWMAGQLAVRRRPGPGSGGAFSRTRRPRSRLIRRTTRRTTVPSTDGRDGVCRRDRVRTTPFLHCGRPDRPGGAAITLMGDGARGGADRSPGADQQRGGTRCRWCSSPGPAEPACGGKDLG